MRDQHTVSNKIKQPGMSMKMSAKGYSVLQHFENIKLQAYPDTGGVWTIGIGTTRYPDGSKVKKGDKITRERAFELMRGDVLKFEQAVDRMLKAPQSQHQFDALVSFTYNIGIAAFEKSTMLKLINQQKPVDEIAAQFHRWNKDNGVVVDGLIRRRKSEAHLYQTGLVEFFEK